MSKQLVLLVEDAADTLSLLKLMLESEGFSVVAATNGAQAVELLASVRPDIIMTDLMLPQLDGLGLIQFVRSSQEMSQIPILALSAFGEDQLARAEELGANVVLRKIEDMHRLMPTLRSLARAPSRPPE